MKTVYIQKSNYALEENERRIILEVHIDETESQDVIDSIILDDAGFGQVAAGYEILRPVEVTGVPTPQQVNEWANKSTEDSGESHMDASEVFGKKEGAKWMLDQLTPLIAQQQNEIEELIGLLKEIDVELFAKHGQTHLGGKIAATLAGKEKEGSVLVKINHARKTDWYEIGQEIEVVEYSPSYYSAKYPEKYDGCFMILKKDCEKI